MTADRRAFQLTDTLKILAKGDRSMQLPTLDELQGLQKGLRKRKLPRVFDDMWCSEPGIGGVKLTAVGSDFHVEWVSFDGDIKSELKHAECSYLCSDPSLEMQRLEIGYVVSETLQAQARKVMDSIGHPIAGHMLGL